jgi:hypothetical protein
MNWNLDEKRNMATSLYLRKLLEIANGKGGTLHKILRKLISFIYLALFNFKKPKG